MAFLCRLLLGGFMSKLLVILFLCLFSFSARAVNNPVTPYAVIAPYLGSVVGGVLGPASAGTALSVSGGMVGGISLYVGEYIGYIAFCPVLNGVTQTNYCTQVDTGTAAGAKSGGTGASPTSPQTPANTSPTNDTGYVGGLRCDGTSGSCGINDGSLAACAAVYLNTGSPSNRVCTAVKPGANCQVIDGGCPSSPSCVALVLASPTCTGGLDPSANGHTSYWPSCQPGYTVSGASCVLSDGYAANPNYTNRDVTKSGTTMTVHLATAAATQNLLNENIITVSASNDTVTVGGTQGGHPATSQLTAGSSGTSCMINTVQNPDGQSVHKTQVCIDANGYVTSKIEWNETGTLQVTPASGVIPIGTGGSGSVGASGVGPSPGGAGAGSGVGVAASGAGPAAQLSADTTITSALSGVSGFDCGSSCALGVGTMDAGASAAVASMMSGMSGITATAGSGVFNPAVNPNWFMPNNASDASTVCGSIYGTVDNLPPVIFIDSLGHQSRLPDVCSTYGTGSRTFDFGTLRLAEDAVLGVLTLWLIFGVITSSED